jgi:hypothetical protein
MFYRLVKLFRLFRRHISHHRGRHDIVVLFELCCRSILRLASKHLLALFRRNVCLFHWFGSLRQLSVWNFAGECWGNDFDKLHPLRYWSIFWNFSFIVHILRGRHVRLGDRLDLLHELSRRYVVIDDRGDSVDKLRELCRWELQLCYRFIKLLAVRCRDILGHDWRSCEFVMSVVSERSVLLDIWAKRLYFVWCRELSVSDRYRKDVLKILPVL